MFALTHQSLETTFWLARASVWRDGCPVLSVVRAERSDFSQATACLISLAQETFKCSPAITSCWPALISISKTSAHLLSMNLIEFQRATTTKVASPSIIGKVHRRWDLTKHSGRAS